MITTTVMITNDLPNFFFPLQKKKKNLCRSMTTRKHIVWGIRIKSWNAGIIMYVQTISSYLCIKIDTAWKENCFVVGGGFYSRHKMPHRHFVHSVIKRYHLSRSFTENGTLFKWNSSQIPFCTRRTMTSVVTIS